MFEAHRLCILSPAAGFGPTWASRGDPPVRRSLDYFVASAELAAHARDLEICSYAIAATSHFPLRLQWGPQEKTVDKQKAKNKVFQRRKWPGWREAAAGQFAALLRPARWANVAAAEADISRPGRTRGTAARTSKKTPFDHFMHFLLSARKKEEGSRRKAVQRDILEVRKQQKQWRVEQRMAAATMAGRNLGKQQSQVQTICLVGKETVSPQKKTFEAHWSTIMCGTTRGFDQPDVLRAPLPSESHTRELSR